MFLEYLRGKNIKEFLVPVMIVFLVIIIIYLVVINREEPITGVWICSPSFLKEAELDNVILYIGEYKNRLFYKEYDAYLFISQDGEAIENQKIKIKRYISSGKTAYSTVTGANSWMSADEEISANLKIRFCSRKQILTIFRTNPEKVIYAELFKDTVASAYAEAVE